LALETTKLCQFSLLPSHLVCWVLDRVKAM
jgi:hypothetical protein